MKASIIRSFNDYDCSGTAKGHNDTTVTKAPPSCKSNRRYGSDCDLLVLASSSLAVARLRLEITISFLYDNMIMSYAYSYRVQLHRVV